MFAAIIAVSLLATADPPKEKPKELPEAAKKELKKLEGKWKIVKLLASTKEGEADGKEPDAFMMFKGTELTLESPNAAKEKKESLKISSIDPTTDPKCIDLVETLSNDRGERIIEAVFKIDGDTLLLAMCIPKESKQRPVGFDKPADPRTLVWTLKREKK